MIGKRALRGNGCQHSVGGTGKGHEESIALRIHFVAVIFLESGAQQLAAFCQYLAIVVSQLPQEVRRFLDIGKEQRDCASREVTMLKLPSIHHKIAAILSIIRYS